jgi:hypothetical protein
MSKTCGYIRVNADGSASGYVYITYDDLQCPASQMREHTVNLRRPSQHDPRWADPETQVQQSLNAS